MDIVVKTEKRFTIEMGEKEAEQLRAALKAARVNFQYLPVSRSNVLINNGTVDRLLAWETGLSNHLD